jgi:hypothetical protein
MRAQVKIIIELVGRIETKFVTADNPVLEAELSTDNLNTSGSHVIQREVCLACV